MVNARRVVFRADASLHIGTGHVMRCLTLADGLRKMGFENHFLCRVHNGHLCDLIEDRGYSVSRLPTGTREVGDGAKPYVGWLGSTWEEDAEQCRAAIALLSAKPELLIVDHYALDGRWEHALRPLVPRILVIDDLADRSHDCDLVLDQNLHDCPESRYAHLVGPDTRVFVGPRYALLRPEFNAFPVRTRERLDRMLVYFGGADPANQALQVMRALRELATEAPEADFVLGPTNANARSVHEASRGMAGVCIIPVTDRMAQLMSDADLGIGTCGGAAWERCVLGLPSLVVVSAENQRDDARILHQLGAVLNLGDAATVGMDCWVNAIRSIRNDPESLKKMSRAATAVMQGRRDVVGELAAALFS